MLLMQTLAIDEFHTHSDAGSIAGERKETRIAEGAVLAISRALAPILPNKFHVNPASVIAASLLDSVLTARPGCRWIFAEDLN